MNDRPAAPTAAPSNAPGPDVQARQRWLAVLARAPREMLRAQADSLMTAHFDTLRAPETGLALVRARVANQGDRYNLGEATLTRCVLRHRAEDGHTTVGVGYVLGRDAERATWVARADALLQQPGWQARLQQSLIEPLAAATAAQQAEEQRRTAASQVRFFTLQPEATA